MKKSRITCDTEVPMTTSNGNKFNHCSGTYHHNYNLPHGNDNDKDYDKPQKMDDNISVGIVGSSQGTVNCIYSNQLSSNKCYSGTRSYDVPKDIINSNILERLSFLSFHL